MPRALERIAGIQAQYAPSMYIGLWSRLEGFERDSLTRALERRAVVQGTLMRATIHLVSRRDYWPFALGVRDARRAWWARSARERGDPRALAAAARKLEPRLAGGASITRAELEELVGKPLAAGAGLWIDLVRVPPSGTWERRRADLYTRADEWLGPPATTAQDGIELLVRRYLQGFGPASRASIADWAGLPVKAVAPAVERVAPRRFRGPSGEELVDVPRAPLPDPETPVPVRLLPTWDATLLVHARSSGLLPEEHRSKIFSMCNPRSESPFLVDGSVAGVWRLAQGGRVELDPFGRLDAAVKRELRAEADRLADFHA